MAQDMLHEIWKVVMHLGNIVLRNDLIYPASFLNASNNEPYQKGISSTTINFDYFVPEDKYLKTKKVLYI